MGFGGSELFLIAAITLLLVGVGRLTRLQPARGAAKSLSGAERDSARQYLDRLIGPARSSQALTKDSVAARVP
jgi:Sec-independent protein translocase protein TatA